jgi:hypothetical protein
MVITGANPEQTRRKVCSTDIPSTINPTSSNCGQKSTLRSDTAVADLTFGNISIYKHLKLDSQNTHAVRCIYMESYVSIEFRRTAEQSYWSLCYTSMYSSSRRSYYCTVLYYCHIFTVQQNLLLIPEVSLHALQALLIRFVDYNLKVCLVAIFVDTYFHKSCTYF